MSSKQPRQSVSPARRRACEILSRVERERAYAAPLLAAMGESELCREDRALAFEIVLGTLRWQRELDYFIERYSGRSIAQLDLPVLIALRIGLYQLRHLDRIPAAAAVNESANLVKQARLSSAASLINAVLRKAANHLGESAGGDIADPLDRAAVALSHPRWMLERWQACMGEEETRALAVANNKTPSAVFRVNALKTSADEVVSGLEARGITSRTSALAPGALVVQPGYANALTEMARSGLIYIQDEASQFVSTLLQPRAGDRVLDLCAAPGSKATHIAALANDEAWIVACDLHHHRLLVLRSACERLGVKSIDAVALDANAPLPFGESAKFDRVLVDAPCSGTGTLRSNPEIKWRLSPADIVRLSGLQLTMLMQAAAHVTDSGRLVYSTCSLEREENEEVIERFLNSNSSFEVARPADCDALITNDGFVRTFPHRHGCDGFFAAVLERVS